MAKAGKSRSYAAPGDKSICNNCIEEKFLSDLVKSTGTRRTCTYCGKTTKAIFLEHLADRIQTVIEKFFERTPDSPDGFEYAMSKDDEIEYEWEREGELVTDVIQSAAEIPRQAAEDVQEILEGRFMSRSREEMGEETEFDMGSQYKFVGNRNKELEEQWNNFENSLRTNTRYFNQPGKTYLDNIFKGLDKLVTPEGGPILIAGPENPLNAVYRARVFLSDESLHTALSNIVDELGPPASKFAKAGRMNAAGISVFYGATETQTALAEVRPPVGSWVAVARFTFMRELRLLNLAALKNISPRGSLFDDAFTDLMLRVQFLRQLSDKMTIPVMPGQEEIEYLITQAIADYLSMNSTTNLDGIIFPSLQTGDGSNIVLFHKASRVKPRTLPAGTKTSVKLWEYDEDDRRYPWFTITEEIPAGPMEGLSFPTHKDPRLVSLAIDEEHIQIHLIQRVQYTTDPQKLDFRRYEKTGDDEMKARVFGRK